MKLDSVKIGQFLTELRKYYKITQDDLAGRLNVSRQAVSKWETGASVPDIELLVSLSEMYGITVNDIIRADLDHIKFQKEVRFPDGEKPIKKCSPSAVVAGELSSRGIWIKSATM